MQVFQNIKLEKDIPIPLYYQLKKQVLELIENSELKNGDLLPAENELCELLDISRPTVRQAFKELVSEGYLQRFKGKGTFVATPKVEERFLSKLEPFNQEMLSKGMKPSTKVLDLRVLKGLGKANEKLKIPMDSEIIYLSRLRFADNIPLVYVETHLPFKDFSKLMDVDFEQHSLYESLEKIYAIRVNRVHREIEAANAKRKEAELLNISINKAFCLVETTAFSDNYPNPIEYSVARYGGDYNKFTVEIYR